MMGYGLGMGGAFGGIGTLLLIALLVVGGVYLVRELDGRRGPRRRSDGASTDEDPALRVLRERYARGEIDREEFEERKRGLA